MAVATAEQCHAGQASFLPTLLLTSVAGSWRSLTCLQACGSIFLVTSSFAKNKNENHHDHRKVPFHEFLYVGEIPLFLMAESLRNGLTALLRAQGEGHP